MRKAATPFIHEPSAPDFEDGFATAPTAMEVNEAQRVLREAADKLKLFKLRGVLSPAFDTGKEGPLAHSGPLPRPCQGVCDHQVGHEVCGQGSCFAVGPSGLPEGHRVALPLPGRCEV